MLFESVKPHASCMLVGNPLGYGYGAPVDVFGAELADYGVEEGDCLGFGGGHDDGMLRCVVVRRSE